MLKKTYAFALVAAAVIIAPTAAFAETYYQSTEQELNQNAAATGNSRVRQDASQRSYQQQDKFGNRYNRNCPTNQSQRSRQRIDQNGVAIDGSDVYQRADQENRQLQANRGC